MALMSPIPLSLEHLHKMMKIFLILLKSHYFMWNQSSVKREKVIQKGVSFSFDGLVQVQSVLSV